jgi:UDP-N-acetylmuramoylalanine--D-glutamate ligase
MKRKWLDKNITVLGLSISGIAASKYLAENGANVTISEKREQKSEDEPILKELAASGIKTEMGGHKEETVLSSYLVVTSPGIPPKAPVLEMIHKNNIELMSDIELAYLETSVPFIAITGTNGKTTTTKLVSEILTCAGFNAPACGNIGIPPISLIDGKIDFLVAELSSYQIERSKTLKPQIACFLNYTPDHIDWHGDAEAYFKAKASLFEGSRAPSWAVLNASDKKVAEIGSYTPSICYYFGKNTGNNCVFIENGTVFFTKNKKNEKIIDIAEIPLIGRHNHENVMAAVAVAKIAGAETEKVREAIQKFKPPEHRLEYVASIEGISYYNDSKATNCDSTICALKAFEHKKVVLIAGGRDKGTDLSDFVKTVKDFALAVVLIGEAADRFQQALENGGFTNIYRADSLEKAVDIVSELKLGTVLLAPACASFDMFKNFEERGRVFKDYVIKKKENR